MQGMSRDADRDAGMLSTALRALRAAERKQSEAIQLMFGRLLHSLSVFGTNTTMLDMDLELTW